MGGISESAATIDAGRRNSHDSLPPNYRPSVNDFEIGGVLGQGSYAKVYEAVNKQNGRKYAMKVVDKEFVKRLNKINTVVNERNIFNTLRGHTGVIRLYFTFQDNYSQYYVLEQADGGELYDQQQQCGKFGLETSRFYAYELATILIYMHEKRVIHRDQKPSNVLLSSNGHIKQTDFGTSKMIVDSDKSLPPTPEQSEEEQDGDDSSTLVSEDLVEVERKRGMSFVGTAEYVSPQQLKNIPLTYGIDWWSFGVILFEMLVGRVPFKGSSEYNTFQAILNNEMEYPEDIDPEARDLLQQQLHPDVHQRLGIHRNDGKQIIQHPFFQSQYTAPVVLAGNSDDAVHTDIFNRKAPKFRTLRANVQSSALHRGSVILQSGVGALSGVSPSDLSVSIEYIGEVPCSKHLQPEESVVICSKVTKSSRWGKTLFAKKRFLVLTSTPRLLYIDETKNVVKGEVLLLGCKFETIDATQFKIETSNRTFLFKVQEAPLLNADVVGGDDEYSEEEHVFVTAKNPEWTEQWRFALNYTQSTANKTKP